MTDVRLTRNTPPSAGIALVGTRQSTKRPRERSASPYFDHSAEGETQPEIDSEEAVLSLSDLIRPLSTTPSPEPSLHFGTPPSAVRLHDTIATTLSQDDSNRTYAQQDMPEEDDPEEVIDDSKAAEMRQMVMDWGFGATDHGLDQDASTRERRLAVMVIALTHPARPTASQIAAQAEHIRALLAERSVMMKQIEDLNEFRHADRLGFERTAQALNARLMKGNKSNSAHTSANEAFYLDERTQHAELHSRNERLHTENVRLERELRDAKREIGQLRQNIEELRVSLLISPRTPSLDTQGAFHSAMVSPTPNPRGRPRKYPLSSPSHITPFQHSAHSNPAAQLPISSTSVLNQGASFTLPGQPPPEKRMRPIQPDARAELLLAAARRVGKDRVVEVLEGLEHAKGTPEPNLETNILDPLVYTHSHTPHSSQREAIPATHSTDHPVRPGRPPKASASFPSITQHQFNQFLVEDANQAYPGNVRGPNVERAGDLGDANSANARRYPQRSQQLQQVVVAFTGDPQADAQACLASFVSQYPGISPTPTWRSGTGGARPHSGTTDELQGIDPVRSAASKTAGTVQRTYSTPELAQSANRSMGLENLLSAARTVFRARSRSTTPTPRRDISSGSSLSSPYRSSSRTKNLQSRTNSGRAGSSQRRHSSPAVPLGDSDTEPEDSPRGPRVYSALDVLADQAAAARTSPDPSADPGDESPESSRRLSGRSAPALGSPALLSAFRPRGSASLPESSPGFSVPPSDLDSSPVSFEVVETQSRAAPKSSLEKPILGVSGMIPNPTSGDGGDPSIRIDEPAVVAADGRVDNDDRQLDSPRGQVRLSDSSLHTPPRSQRARGNQRV